MQVFGLAPDKLWVISLLVVHLVQPVTDMSQMSMQVDTEVKSEILALPPVIDPAGPFCELDDNVFLTANPPGGTWSGPGIVNGSTGEFSPSSAGSGSHIITYTDPLLEMTTTTIVVYPSPEIAFISGDGTDCHGGSTGNTILTVIGGTQIGGPPGCHYLYDWDWDGTTDNDSYPSTCSGGIDQEDLSNLPAGMYFVTVTDANGCTVTGSTLVDEPAMDVTPVADDVEVPCNGDVGGTIDLDVAGGTPPYMYDWDWDGTSDNDDMGGAPSYTDDAQDPTILGTGTYTVTVTDFLGCTAIIDVIVTEPEELEASASAEPALCTGEASGEIELNVSGGTPSYSFDWNYDGTGDNDDPQNPQDLPAGTYTVTVTDAHDCTATAMVTVTEPLSAVMASVNSTDPSCFGENDGTIDLTPGGGTGMYSFDWDNDGTGDNDDPEDLSGLPHGNYSVTVTDANGCIAVASVILQEPPEITGTHNETICAGGSVIVNGTTYDENNTSGTEVFTAGNGCDSIVAVNISFDLPLTGEINYQGCEGDGYGIVVNGTIYDQGNPSGTETLTTPDGCDSIVMISLEYAPPVTGEEIYSGCEGDGYEVIINGTTYNEGNPSGTETLTGSNGCDSIVTISLTFAGETMSTITNDGCEEDGFSVIINGTVYNENNPSGTEVIQNQAGCDSTIVINLVFNETSTGEELHSSCSGSGFSIVVNGTIYDESNPSGTETLVNNAGCDSVVTIELTFIEPVTGEETYDGCEGDGYSVLVNGTLYDQNNPTGVETLTAGSGCDSIVTITLTFSEPLMGEETYDGCEGDGYSVLVGGSLYNEGNFFGMETLTSSGGCDSVVTVLLNFAPSSEFELIYQGCEDDGYQINVGGSIYNENNPNGIEILQNDAGCDSVVTINLTFETTSTGEELYAGCEGDGYSVVVNGAVYNENNPTGTEILVNNNGCDSIVTIDLIFSPASEHLITYNGCEGDGYEVQVGSQIYNELNPDGVEILTGANGCDSIVTVDLNFTSVINTLIQETLCSGAFIDVGGTIYDQGNPNGTEQFVAQGGCDSIVTIDLTFDLPLEGLFEYTGCIGDGFSIVINGEVYDENNPSGSELIQNSQGCDSIVTINLEFVAQLTGEELYTGCTGDGYSVIVNGSTYNEDNPSGTETITTSQGCDSIVTIDLIFVPAGTSEVLYDGCAGDGFSVVVNNTQYDEDNPSGQEFIQTQNGCDSLVTIDLVFHEADTTNLSHSGCIGDGYTITVNGNIYDEFNPVGTEIISNTFGCDSVIEISLEFSDLIEVEYHPVVCAGGSIEIDGTIYDADNPTDTLIYIAEGGCDSLVYIALGFAPVLQGAETYQGCAGDGYSVVVNGVTYDESNSTGTESFQNSSGCDTIVTIDLHFDLVVTIQVDSTLCSGDSLVINETVYDLSNPSGTESLPGSGSCDTIIEIDLDFYPLDTSDVLYTGCMGDGYTISVNGTVYGESNPTGTEVLTNNSGCDSVVVVSLVFNNCCQPDTLHFMESICEGNTFPFDGLNIGTSGTYTAVVSDAVGPGCDSVYILDLVVASSVTGHIIEAICEGEQYPFGGEIYTTSGIYYDTIPGGASGGCDSIAELVLTVSALPVAIAGADKHITCAEPSVILEGSLQGGLPEWAGPGITPQNQNTLTPLVNKPGLYILTVSGPAGCSSSDEVLVTIDDDTPVADAGPDLALSCKVESVVLVPEVTGQNLSIEWEGPGIVPGSEHDLQQELSVPGVYILSVVDTMSMCAAIPDTVVVTDITNQVAAIVQDPGEMNCSFQFVELDGSQSTSGQSVVYVWMDPEGNYLSDMAVVQVADPGQYLFMVIDTITGCNDSLFVDVVSGEVYPAIVLNGDPAITCANQEAMLIAAIQGPGSDLEFQWTGPAGGLVGDPGSLAIEAVEEGWYLFTATDTINGCSSTDSLFIEDQVDYPTAVAVVDQHITCTSSTGQLHGIPSQDDLIYVWYSGTGSVLDTSDMIEVGLPGLYILEVINPDNGCSATDTTEVEQSDVPVAILEAMDETCRGDEDGIISVIDVSGGSPPYSYIITGSGTQPGPVFQGLAPGDYAVSITDAEGCTWETQVVIQQGVEVTLDIGLDLVLHPGDQYQLHGEINVPLSMLDSLVWSPASLLSCAVCQDPVLIGTQSTTIYATAFAMGCTATDQLQLTFESDRQIFIPNVFTPNFDHINDGFTVMGGESVEQILSLEVFDRWGERVFSTANIPPNVPELGWDGSFRGKPLNPGVYVYHAYVAFADGTSGHFSGDVTLIR